MFNPYTACLLNRMVESAKAPNGGLSLKKQAGIAGSLFYGCVFMCDALDPTVHFTSQ